MSSPSRQIMENIQRQYPPSHKSRHHSRNTLFLNLPCPIPSTRQYRFPITDVFPDCHFCYTSKNVTPESLDDTWVNRSLPMEQSEQTMRIILETTTVTNACPVFNDNQERWTIGNLPLFQRPCDAIVGKPWSTTNEWWYNLQQIVAQQFQKRRFHAGWHPQVRVWDKKKESKLFDKINEKMKKTKRTPIIFKKLTK